MDSLSITDGAKSVSFDCVGGYGLRGRGILSRARGRSL